MALSNTAVPKYYGQFRDKVLAGEIPVCEEISMEMNRIDNLIKNPGIYYDDAAIDGFIAYCESEMTLTDGSDLVLLDIFLSDDVDGVCVAQEIRKTSDTPFIYITASRDRRTFERAMQTNPAEIISKPYSEAMLKRSIERVMSEI